MTYYIEVKDVYKDLPKELEIFISDRATSEVAKVSKSGDRWILEIREFVAFYVVNLNPQLMIDGNEDFSINFVNYRMGLDIIKPLQ